MKFFISIFFFLISSVSVLPGISLAAENKLFDPSQPVSLKSKHIIVNQKNGSVTYKGKVLIKQGDLLIMAAKAKTKTVGKQPSHVWATGNPVKLQSKRDDKLVIITALSAHYNVKSGMITLTDNVQLQMGKDIMRSKQLSYNVKTNKIIVKTKNAPLSASFDSAHIDKLRE